ncbi:HAD family hydrolase [Prochlorococcus marinus]|uniref:HAD family hydrolase n=1 Tax=Prochlorococcus marinus TaxID=1219 RepID=UPI0022B378D0|nr:HAD family hydrolase [Prochlorococcus marinus]
MQELLLRGKSIGKIKGILFDKDGTLVNSEKHLIKLASQRILEAINICKQNNYSSRLISEIHLLLLKAYGLTLDGINPNGAIAIASRKDNLISTATVFSLVGEHWSKAVNYATYIFNKADETMAFSNHEYRYKELEPGLLNFINILHRNNIKLAIISNDSRNGIYTFLKDKKLEKKIPIFLGSDDNPQKPSPGAIKKVCKLINLKASECALIGDSDTDLKMASESNIAIILGYTGGWKTPPLLYEYHHMFHHWDELSLQQAYIIKS